MRNISVQETISELIKSDVRLKYKYDFLEVLRAMNILQPWEISDYLKLIGNKRENKLEDIEEDEINVFKKNFNSQIQRLDLSKEEVMDIVESLYCQ